MYYKSFLIIFYFFIEKIQIFMISFDMTCHSLFSSYGIKIYFSTLTTFISNMMIL